MHDWILPQITDYWDERVEAIERLSRVIAEAPEHERDAQLSLVGAAVARHAQALTDEAVTRFAAPIVDDLYKALSKRTYFDEPLLQYLTATGGPFFKELTARGYTVHYFIDNVWQRLEGPAIAFKMWFSAAGLFYICPQEIACNDFEKDRPRDEWPALVARHVVTARIVAKDLVNRCQAAGRHFVYLDIDAAEFDTVLETSQGPGVIFLFRQEAPTPGSHCAVRMPEGPRKV